VLWIGLLRNVLSTLSRLPSTDLRTYTRTCPRTSGHTQRCHGAGHVEQAIQGEQGLCSETGKVQHSAVTHTLSLSRSACYRCPTAALRTRVPSYTHAVSGQQSLAHSCMPWMSSSPSFSRPNSFFFGWGQHQMMSPDTHTLSLSACYRTVRCPTAALLTRIPSYTHAVSSRSPTLACRGCPSHQKFSSSFLVQHQMMSPDTRDAPLTPQVAAPRRSALDDIENFHAPTFLDFNLLDASGRLTPEDWSGITGLDDSAQWFDHAHPEQEVRSPIKARVCCTPTTATAPSHTHTRARTHTSPSSTSVYRICSFANQGSGVLHTTHYNRPIPHTRARTHTHTDIHTSPSRRPTSSTCSCLGCSCLDFALVAHRNTISLWILLCSAFVALLLQLMVDGT
jgi:hypothetical protein